MKQQEWAVQAEGKSQEGPIVMRAQGKSFGQLDPKTLRWSMNRGRVVVTFDLRESLKAGRAVTVEQARKRTGRP